MKKSLYRVERERVVTDWWFVEANDEKEAKTKAFNSEIDDSDYGEDINVTINKVEEEKWKMKKTNLMILQKSITLKL